LKALPEKLRGTLERAVKELAAKETVYGVGLFGSWSRDDATASSDVDLFVLDNADFAYEYVERIDRSGFSIDLDYVPRKWIHGPIPPEIDQKLYEMQILYDRDWSLTNTKLIMTKAYGSSERVDIRTEAHLVDSDIYLSRATSAFSRHDYKSSHIFALTALETTIKLLIEITLQPFSNSRFMETAQNSTEKLGMRSLFKEYTEMSGFNKANPEKAKRNLRLFKTIWEDIKSISQNNPQKLDTLHFKVKTRLNYYLNHPFLHSTMNRVTSMIETGNTLEAAHYLNNLLLDIIENFSWLESAIRNFRIDYSTLFRTLENLNNNGPTIYRNAIEFFGVGTTNSVNSTRDIAAARAAMINVRKSRKLLIKKFLVGK